MASQPEILTKEQKRFLDLVSAEAYFAKHYYFTGGTPLTAFYLQHRLSEDIDLFTEQQEVYLPAVRAFIGKAQKILKLKKVDYRQYLGLHTFQLYFSAKNILKVDFNYYPFPRIEKGMRYGNLQVDSLLDIAVNKVHTIAMKPRARDFIDIYFIIKQKGYEFDDLLLKAKAKFDWHIDALQLGSRLLQAETVADFPRMLKKIDDREWRKFFREQAKKLKSKILKP